MRSILVIMFALSTICLPEINLLRLQSVEVGCNHNDHGEVGCNHNDHGELRFPCRLIETPVISGNVDTLFIKLTTMVMVFFQDIDL